MTDRFLQASLVAALLAAAPAAAQFKLHSFTKRQLDKEFHCEGATFGDLDRDGHMDLISGPYWYKGPTFEKRTEYYKPHPFNPRVYSDNFFAFVHDFDADGWNDILIIGFPGKDASWFRNPKGAGGHWQRHIVFDVVDNESPTFTDIDGDGKPELVCQTKDRMGFAEVDWAHPEKTWTFHPISDPARKIGGRFTHGLGVGDVNGDGRQDVMFALGWFEQPASLEGDPVWPLHLVNFAGRGGAQMYAYDIDGDGDNDVVSSHNAHGFGLYWFEQVQREGKIAFVRHRIMGQLPRENRYGVAVGNLHAVDLIDMDGDGLKDIVTGNRYWAHSGRDAADNQEPPIYWFQLVRTGEGAGTKVHFVPHLIDGKSGVGTQVVAGDINGDGHPDVVVGNKMGTFVHTHAVREVTREEWYEAQREFITKATARRDGNTIDRSGGYRPKGADGKPLNLGFESGSLADWTATGDAFEEHPIKGDTVHPRRSDMKSEHDGSYWVGTYEPRHSDDTQGTLTSKPFVVTDRYASFLIGGGDVRGARVELVLASDGKAFYTARGKNRENLGPVSVDLQKYVGKQVFIRIVDEAKGHWGHVNFDDFLLHKTNPSHEGKVGAATDLSDQKEGFLAPEAARRMGVPEGFKVEVVAAEPTIHQPIGFCTDDKGRLWVAEAHSYPQRRPGDKAKDRIVVLEDSTGDGKFDKSTVFVDDLNLISGIAVGHGGVWVGAAPYFMFFPDKDRDCKPDGAPQVLLDGWGYQDTHETLNSFIWGPDGWLYGCHGVFTHSRVGKPGTPRKDRVPLNAGVWRYHPRRHEFEVFAWGASNQWGVDFDDHGQAFITACVIPHLYHVIQGGRYHRQSGQHFNPHVYDDIKTIADHLHYLGSRPHAGNGVSNSVGGGHAHCGAMIYLGGAFPEQYRNAIFMNNVHGNRVNTDIPRREGSGFVGTHGPDFLLANDKWFRGINLKYGPDGSVFVIDWYDKQACHLRQPEVWDRTNGRLYKVSYGNPAPCRVDIAALSDADLVEMQLHDNDWYVRMSRRVLQERGGNASVHAGLSKLLAEHADVRKRLRALWALHVTGGLTEDLVTKQLSSDEEYLRAWTIQLATEGRKVSDAVAGKLAEMARDDSSPVVRLYLASALQRLQGDVRWAIAEGLVGHGEDAGDHNLPLMVWYGCEPLVAENPKLARALLARCKLQLVQRFICRRLSTAEGGTAVLTAILADLEDEAEVRIVLEEMVAALKKRDRVAQPEGWASLYRRFRAAKTGRIREDAQALAIIFGDVQVLPEIRSLLADRSAELGRREWALDNLLRVRDPDTVPVLQGLLDDAGIRRKAIAALGRFDDPKTAPLLVARFAQFGGNEQATAVTALVSRASYAKALLTAVADGRIPKNVLDSATTRRQVRALKDPEIDALMTKAWGRSQPSSEDILAQIAKYKAELTDAALEGADLPAGRAVYGKTCMVCHKLFGSGGEIGPDITGSNRANLDYILSNILDPNAEVAKEYMLTMVETKDGGVFGGIIIEENDAVIRLRTATGDVEQIARRSVAVGEDGKPSITTQPISMMPMGQLLALSKAEVRDLIAYLRSPEQVPMLATEATLPQFFNGKDLTGWDADPKVWSVEDGALVGRTKTGLKRNNFARSHMTFGDFRLVVEVRLTENQGNSGIQFRSKPFGNDGLMQGYQADIGKGWWGKLYDEHGRGTLANELRDHLVKNGDWNTYEIVAVGQKVRTAINGQLCVDLDDPKGALRGILGLQVHSGGPTEVRFRNFQFELNPEFGLKTLKK